MTIAAAVLAGVPPSGLGCYVWQTSAPPGDWDFYCVTYTSRTLTRALLDAGKRVWLFAGPSAWAPGAWRATLAECLALAAADSRIVGIVANPEEAWRSAGSAEAAEFGRALAAAAERTRVGVVTIPAQPHLATTVAAAGSSVWWSIELYANSAAPSSFATWAQRWSAAGVPRSRLSMTVAGFTPPSELGRATMATRETYRAYLDALPSTSGAIVWGNNSLLSSRAWMLEELSRRYAFHRTLLATLEGVVVSRLALVAAGAAVLLAVAVAVSKGLI